MTDKNRTITTLPIRALTGDGREQADRRATVQAAGVVLAVDVVTEQQALVCGRAALEAATSDQPS